MEFSENHIDMKLVITTSVRRSSRSCIPVASASVFLLCILNPERTVLMQYIMGVFCHFFLCNSLIGMC